MSQYGIVPQKNIAKLKLEYSIASPSTWLLKKGQETYGGVEVDMFSQEQKSELLALEGIYFEDAEAFQIWLNS